MSSQDQSRVPLGQRSRVFRGKPPQMNSRLVPKAGIHDPRGMPTAPAHRRYSDLESQWQLKAAWASAGMTSLHLARLGAGVDSRYPLQVQNTPFFVALGVVNEVKLLIPRNKNRFRWSIANFTQPGAEAYWSYGVPPEVESGFFLGNPLTPGDVGPLPDSSNSVSIDAIYVFTRTATPIYILGYEGTIAPEANAG
jgi:hypothetical protein